MNQTYDRDAPYCGDCGHNLTGCVDSSKCPECGRPLVEVLVRGMRWGKRFRSRARLFGLPVIDVAYGPAPGEVVGRARGIIAMGDRATGVLAIGGRARGVVACGGLSMGVFAYGGIAVGLLAGWGGITIGALAVGGIAVGLATYGGIAAGFFSAGGVAAGYYAMGGLPIGAYTAGPGTNAPEAIAMLSRLTWFYGPLRFSLWNIFQPFFVVIGLGLAAAACIGVLALLGAPHVGFGRGMTRQLYDITPPITPAMNVWPGDTPPTREVRLDMHRGDNLTLSTLRATVHLGAHADAPSHYGTDARSIERQDLEPYLGPCQVLPVAAERGRRIGVGDLRAEVEEPRVLLATGTFPDPEDWNEDFAGLAPDLIDHLHALGVRLVGVDTPSVDLFDDKALVAHQRFLALDVAILEGLVLRGVPPGRYELIALPLPLVGFDASPVRAVLRPL